MTHKLSDFPTIHKLFKSDVQAQLVWKVISISFGLTLFVVIANAEWNSPMLTLFLLGMAGYFVLSSLGYAYTSLACLIDSKLALAKFTSRIPNISSDEIQQIDEELAGKLVRGVLCKLSDNYIYLEGEFIRGGVIKLAMIESLSVDLVREYGRHLRHVLTARTTCGNFRIASGDRDMILIYNALAERTDSIALRDSAQAFFFPDTLPPTEQPLQIKDPYLDGLNKEQD